MMRPRLKPLRDQVIVITGATSGIGLVTAREAARQGASAFLISRNAAALERQSAEIMRTSGVRAAFAAADVGDESQVLAAAARALEQFGRIDTWVNVAGVGIYAPLLDTPLHEHERLFRTNYWGVVNASRAAIKHLRGGAFITVASVVADFGTPLRGAYAASKHAIKGYIDCLRVELLAERGKDSTARVRTRYRREGHSLRGTTRPPGNHRWRCGSTTDCRGETPAEACRLHFSRLQTISDRPEIPPLGN